MPPSVGIAGAGCSSFFSKTSDSVVRTVEATEAAFWSALLETFVGSIMPASNISTYFSVAASKPKPTLCSFLILSMTTAP